uniref:transglycosylase SLT domain-containing protein n=1 Tax=Halomonas sp. TaxID=1486246 RepID=UPI00356A0F65
MIVKWLRPTLAMTALLWLTGCAMLAPAPPNDQRNVCEIFREQPSWYDHARSSQEKWGTPISTQMAFIQRESSFRSHVKPPRQRLLGFIPWTRPSSAYGYAQAQDPVWGEYEDEAGSLLARRTHIKHATDFIGWYNARTHRMTGVSLHNPEHLYLAYH